MAYTTLMVQLESGCANTAVLQAAGDLAERFQAQVVGIAACRPMQMVYGEAYLSGELIAQEKKQMQADVDAAEDEFRSALQTRAAGLAWRSMVMFAPMADLVVHEARSADLFITARGANDSLEQAQLNKLERICQRQPAAGARWAGGRSHHAAGAACLCGAAGAGGPHARPGGGGLDRFA